jgi:hypothetical protein
LTFSTTSQTIFPPFHFNFSWLLLNLEEQDAMKQNTIEGKLLLEQVTGSKSHASQSNEATSSMPAVIAVTQLDPT